jgi:suppressor for copper-sensitivity B
VPASAALALVAALAAAPAALATEGGRAPQEKAELRLVASRSAFEPGTTARLAAVVAVDPGWHLQAHVPTYDYLIPTVLSVETPAGWGAARVEYPEPIPYEFAFAEEPLDVYEGRVILPFEVDLPPEAAGPARLGAALRYQACDDRSCLPPVTVRASLELAVGSGGAELAAEIFAGGARIEAAAGSAPPAGTAPAGASLAGMLLLALVGGLILNAMPCVLPILSLKAFGLVKAAGQASGPVRAGALATTAGIVLSFWALAGAAIAAKGAGAAVGWGIQFQQPGFVAFLAVVVLFFTLNLWGLFEIQLPSRLMTAAEKGGAREGLAGHFASGLFATLMATPCSAPFLGTALSFALAQNAGTILAIFTAVGLGLALPYVLLAIAPGAAKLLPRPGAWMDTLRGAMGFLLAGAVVWLLYVLSAQIAPERLAFFQVFLLATSLGLWFAHRSRAGSTGKRVGWAVALLLAAGSVLLAARAPAAEARSTGAAAAGAEIAWTPFDRAEAERLSAEEGRLVFLDITAEWCVTCKVNEKLVLHTPEVAGAFAEHGVVAMKADWTNRDDSIAHFLAEHGRYGIPFYMLYRPGAAPHVFGELITRQGIVEVVAAAASATATP